MNPKMKSAIEKITLNDATFSNEVIEPTYVNFFYGKNGAGKSTIARTFKANDERLQWQAGKASTDYDYPELSVSASQIPWSLDDGIGTMLPVMQSDIHLQRGNTVLIIDAKYYSHTTQSQFDKHTIHSNNLYQIFTYVKNRSYQFGEEKNTVSGMLLYAKTEEEIQPDNVYQMHGSQISVKTLDLNQPFAEIANQMDRIVESHFSGLAKKY